MFVFIVVVTTTPTSTNIITTLFVLRRKKCINCGCPKEFHEMEQDPASIPIAIPLRHMSLEILSDGDCEKKHLEKYVWYPPETSFQVVSL